MKNKSKSKNKNTEQGFAMIPILFAILIAALVILPLYLDRIKAAKETKERAKVQVEQIEKQVETQARDFEKKMQEDLGQIGE